MSAPTTDRAGPKPPDPTLVFEAWNEAARGYREYWSPRFRPFVERAVAAFDPPAEGPLAVPGCGPGDEVVLLAQKFPARAILASDPSSEMVGLCRAAARAAGASSVLVTQSPAEGLAGSVRQAAGVFSSFTLQLLADPLRALGAWSLALRRGGAITVIFWPRPGPDTSFGRVQAAIERATGQSRPDWEPKVAAELPHLGLEIERDERVALDVEHASPEEWFQAAVEWGALRPVFLRWGPAVLERCRVDWLSDHRMIERGGKWIVPSEARLWTLRKTGEGPHEAH
ncbi:MAG TPA: class I SAM-dependent methyltransferase [Planctomycetota bacterium]|jgi:trans-aconitate methyltransferase|nr:class I SAM-dependent methyltransferase [Planctomycetota bacterium]